MKIGEPARARPPENGGRVSKKSRPSIHKREREFKKSQRQQKKAERAAAKRDKAAENPAPGDSLAATPETALPPDSL